MMDRCRLDLHEVKFASDKTGVFSGYGGVTGNKDGGGDVIAKGAFRDTLREWQDKGKFPPMLLQHGGGFLGGAMDQLPVGKYTDMEENAKGLKVEGELFALNTERGQYIYEGMKAGSLDGLSIGYRVKEFVLGTKPTEPRRTIKSLDLVEVSIVTFPMNDKARIGAVKSGDIKTIREFEDFLRDVGGYSHAAAKAIAAGGFKAADPRDEDDAGIAAIIRRNIAKLNPKG
jgi:Escherichia/Staphylococcus phage prohead protease